jgi:PhzF family phenazine biosynthesis protein
MPIPLHIIDAFTNRPFRGNPAAVCLLEEAVADEVLQEVGAEMNLSETAFLLREKDHFHLRWFTPTVEVDLCGHATLASAHFLWETGILPPAQPALFQTRSGVLTCTLQGTPTDRWIAMDFPAEPAAPLADPAELLAALHHPPLADAPRKNRMDYLVELADAAAVRAFAPDLEAIARLPGRAVIVTARGDAPYDFVSRFFAPAVGVPEDPVTGSAHCALAPYWCEKLGKTRMTGFQASARGGIVRVQVEGAQRITLSGQAVTVVKGECTALARTDRVST